MYDKPNYLLYENEINHFGALLNKVWNVQVSDTTGDAMKIYCRHQKLSLFYNFKNVAVIALLNFYDINSSCEFFSKYIVFIWSA